MKLSPRAYSIFWDAHAQVGVLASLVLFVVFFLGSFALFAEELAPWQEPAFRGEAVSDEVALQSAQQIANRQAVEGAVWFGISLPTEEEPLMRVWHMDESGAIESSWLDPLTGATIGQRSDLGEFLNALHFLEPIPFGKEIAGVASIVLFFLVVTGLLIQLGKIVRELLQFRPDKLSRVLWSDAHKVVGVVTSPLLALFAITGAVLCLGLLAEPAFVRAALDGEPSRMEEAVDWPAPPPATGRKAGAPDLRNAWALANERFPESEHRWFFFDNLGDEAGIVHLPGESEGKLHAFDHVRVNLQGELIWSRERGGGTVFSRWMDSLYGLHFATWAGFSTKLVYALLSWLVAFGILAGNFLWLERRRRSGRGRADVLLERAMAGVCAGLPVAVGALFVANQLLPRGLDGRAGVEQTIFWIVWGVALAVASWREGARRIATKLLITAACLFAFAPLLDLVVNGRAPFSGPEAIVFTELLLLAVAALCAMAGRAVAGREAPSPLPTSGVATT